MDRQSQELMPLTAQQHRYPADVDIANPRGVLFDGERD
jgi:hypothetical protein